MFKTDANGVVGWEEHPPMTEHFEAKVYPNPTHDYTTLQFNQALSQRTELILYNALGQKVLQEYLNASQREFTIPLKMLQAGAYLLELHDSNGLLARQRLLVQ